MRRLLHLWSRDDIRRSCARAHSQYLAKKRSHATAYFAAHPELKDSAHPYKAKDMAAALPAGEHELADLIPRGLRHVHYRSANSSQVLALAILGSARRADPTHRWLWEALGPLPSAKAATPYSQPEVPLDASVLGEDPEHVTSIDYLVKDDTLVMCIESKWTENGIGTCSCRRSGGDPAVGRCRDAVLKQRPLYWEAAYNVFRLPERTDGAPCPLSPVYQAVRNVAAALQLRPPDGLAVFGLIYDADNPYFSGCGEWPGWPTVLSEELDGAHPDLEFRSVSWQELVPLLGLDPGVLAWAKEKHGLPG